MKAYLLLLFVLLYNTVHGQKGNPFKPPGDESKGGGASSAAINYEDAWQESKISLQAVQQEFNSLKKQRDDERTMLRDSIEKLKAERKALYEIISTSVGAVPTIVDLLKIRAFDTQIAALFQTNKPGRLRVTLLNTTNGAKESMTTEFASQHLVHFSNLSSSSSYSVTAVVLNGDGKETVYKRSPAEDSKLNINTLKVSGNPTVNVIRVDPKVDGIGIVVKYDKPVALAVDFYSIEDSTTMDYRLMKTMGSITTDDFKCPIDIPTAQTMSSQRSFLLTGLASDRDYYYKIRAMDENGKRYEDLNFRRVKTKPSFPALDFREGVELKFSTLQSEITWEASSKPESAQVTFSLPGRPAVNIPTEINNTKVKATFDYSLIQTMVVEKGKTDVPLVTISMKDAGGIEKIIKCKAYFALPNKGDIAKSKLSQTDKDSIIKVSELVTNTDAKKKIDWTDIVKTGLPILLSIL